MMSSRSFFFFLPLSSPEMRCAGFVHNRHTARYLLNNYIQMMILYENDIRKPQNPSVKENCSGRMIRQRGQEKPYKTRSGPNSLVRH